MLFEHISNKLLILWRFHTILADSNILFTLYFDSGKGLDFLFVFPQPEFWRFQQLELPDLDFEGVVQFRVLQTDVSLGCSFGKKYQFLCTLFLHFFVFLRLHLDLP